MFHCWQKTNNTTEQLDSGNTKTSEINSGTSVYDWHKSQLSKSGCWKKKGVCAYIYLISSLLTFSQIASIFRMQHVLSKCSLESQTASSTVCNTQILNLRHWKRLERTRREWCRKQMFDSKWRKQLVSLTVSE